MRSGAGTDMRGQHLAAVRLLLIGAVCGGLAVARPAIAEPLPRPVVDVGPVQSEIEDLLAHADGAIGLGERSVALKPVARFYAERRFQPAWLEEGGLGIRAATLRAAFLGAGEDGLQPADYLVAFDYASPPAPKALVSSPRDLARSDIMLSAALARFVSDLRGGRLERDQWDPRQFVPPDELDIAGILASAASSADLGGYLHGLIPANPIYTGLRRSLAEYRRHAAAGGWPTLGDGERLQFGDFGDQVGRLRDVMVMTGDLPASEWSAGVTEGTFDVAMELAVKSFQARYGLTTDGVVGAGTRSAMNIPVDARIRQILVNMERVRWLPDDLGDPHVLVNLAGFDVEYVEAGVITFDMRAIVGKPARSSPVFSSTITYLEINPTWSVPRIIAVEDLLPKIRKNPHFLAANGFTLTAAATGGIVDPLSVDWARVSASAFPYRLRQAAGRRNALGRIKFMFPNHFDVYLHDTPSRGLFARDQRAYSSGCIRVEKPLDLALKLLEANGSWTRERLLGIIAGGGSQTVGLRRPVPVHLTYLTAWRDPDGTVNFRDDIYSRDKPLETALFARRINVAQAGGDQSATR